MQNTHCPCQILIKLEFSRHIFEKFFNIKFHENSSNGNGVFDADSRIRRTERHDEAKGRSSQL